MANLERLRSEALPCIREALLQAAVSAVRVNLPLDRVDSFSESWCSPTPVAFSLFRSDIDTLA